MILCLFPDNKRKIDKKWRKEHYEKLSIGLPWPGTRETWKQEGKKSGEFLLAGVWLKQGWLSEF